MLFGDYTSVQFNEHIDYSRLTSFMPDSRKSERVGVRGGEGGRERKVRGEPGEKMGKTKYQ